MLSTFSFVGITPCLKPKPQRLTRGATVMSKAPSVSLDTCCAISKTSSKRASVAVDLPVFILLITDWSLNIESDWSTFFSSASIWFFRLLGCWYVILYIVPKTNPSSFWYGATRCCLTMSTVPTMSSSRNGSCHRSCLRLCSSIV